RRVELRRDPVEDREGDPPVEREGDLVPAPRPDLAVGGARDPRDLAAVRRGPRDRDLERGVDRHGELARAGLPGDRADQRRARVVAVEARRRGPWRRPGLLLPALEVLRLVARVVVLLLPELRLEPGLGDVDRRLDEDAVARPERDAVLEHDRAALEQLE